MVEICPVQICRTVPLEMVEHIICASIGFSSILLAAIVKATPEPWVNKINITLINEDKVISDDDPIMSALKGGAKD